jgi:AcrR family transcriptional regulator
MNEADLRVQRTRRLLREAFLELVIAHGYEAVSVMDITRRAQVGHKTFYRHYADKEGLLYTILQEILTEGQGVLLPPSTPEAAEQNTVAAVRFAEQHAALLQVLLQSPAAEKLMEPLVLFGLSEGERFFAHGRVPAPLVAHHFVSSMMSLIRWWLVAGRPYPADEMAEYINQLLIRPLKT